MTVAIPATPMITVAANPPGTTMMTVAAKTPEPMTMPLVAARARTHHRTSTTSWKGFVGLARGHQGASELHP